ncbi:hypothetical protein [Cecembia rubra]|uniref:Zinc dependent phospholipase C n=1 Tax=Cecembia rubra TaxID=1485585 RepID=A0A2P8E4R2_9BACT|nr:hypothetical protein [Cecembia rubra]PSL04417.1 hypothetical protein CLV48_105161 [Cecembia rubra]
MPGPALHHIIAETLRKKILNGQGLGNSADYSDLQNLLSDPKNLPYYFLGCQGPDFLFFNTKDWPVPLVGEGVEIYYKVYDAIEEFKKTLSDLVPQPIHEILDALGALEDQVVQHSSTLTEIEQLFSDMKAVLEGLLANLTEMISNFITKFDLYEQLGHPYRDGETKGEWWWFDALHYRKSGRFLKTLLDEGSNHPQHFLYSLGYLTHFTGDTVGHAYVNINSGGPYRNHSQRHKTCENYQDVFNTHILNNTDWNSSKIHAYYNFNFSGKISPIGANSEIPDPSSKMPDHLAKFIADCINKLYGTGDSDDDEYGKKINPSDVDNAYRIYYKWLKSATDTGTLPAPVPYSLTAELLEVWETAINNLGEIGDFISNAINSAGNFNILGMFLALAAIIIAAVATALALIDAILGALSTLTVAGIRYLASLVYEHLYNAFQNFRLGVSLNGLAFPMMEHLNEPRFQQFKNTAFNDPLGRNASFLKNHFPAKKFKLPTTTFWQEFFHREKHLIYPPKDGELKLTLAGPILNSASDYYNSEALFYVTGDIPLHQKFIDALADLGPGDDDTSFQKIYLELRRTDRKNPPALGNAIDLTLEIFDRWRKQKKFPDFNLDADRGYAYPCWVQMGDPREAPSVLKHNPETQISFIKNL